LRRPISAFEHLPAACHHCPGIEETAVNRPAFIPFFDRLRLICYGAIGGFVIGALFGWFMHGWIGFFVRLFVILLFLTPLILAFLFWQRVQREKQPPPGQNVRDADWVELEPRSRTRE
jgi:hypothetical protein